MPVEPEQLVEVIFDDQDRLIGYVLAITGDYHLAEDVAQDALRLAFEKRAVFNDRNHVLAWLRVTAKREALAAMRRKNAEPLLFSAEAMAQIEQADEDTAETNGADRRAALARCVEQLTPRARRMIELRYGKQMTGQRLAEAMSLKVNSAYMSLSRVHLTLRDCVRRRLAEGERG